MHDTTWLIQMAIRTISCEMNEIGVLRVEGFGSYFRTNCGKDIDLLIVLDDRAENLIDRYTNLLVHFEKLGNSIGVPFDITVLLESEATQGLLLESDSLISLWSMRR